ncbi:MAG: hypothetical protein ACE5JD_07970 [Candidatus Methylomirabilia bacterium]
MKVLLLLLTRRLRTVPKLVKDREGVKLAVLGAFAGLFALVMVGEYEVFLRAFTHINRELGVGAPALTLYTLESFLVLVWLIALVSFVISGLWIFFRASDNPLLLSTPLPLTTLYWLRATETFSLTSWASVVLALPALLALGASYGGGSTYYLLAVAVLALFMAFTGGAGAILTTLAGAALGRVKIRTTAIVAGLLLIGSFALAIGRNVVPSMDDFTAIFEPGIMNGKPGSIKFIEAKFRLWPSHPFAVILYTSATGQPAGSEASRTALWLAPLLALATAAFPGRWLYRRTFPGVAEGLITAASRATTTAPATGVPFPRVFRGPVGSLLERDLLRLSRNPQELGQAAFLLLLLAVYIAFLFMAPFHEVADKRETVARLSLLNLIAAGYFLTAFGLRFVFPSLSLEGPTAWVLFASPVRLFRFFLARLALYATLLFLVVGPIAIVGMLRLISSPALLVTFGLLLALVTLTTVAASLGFGVLWPNFREPKPESLATNAGGLATTLLCLAYVAVMGWLSHETTLALTDGQSAAGPLFLAVMGSALIVGGIVAAASRKIKRLEVT